MTLRLSTGLRNQLLGLTNPVVNMIAANTIAFVDDPGGDTITDTGDGFVAAGFKIGDTVYIDGSAANDAVNPVLTGVAVGTLSFAAGTLAASESASNVIAVASAKGGSLADIMQNGYIMIYSGTQPATADAAYGATALVKITVASGNFTSGTETNGLEFKVSASGEIEKNTDVWSGVGLAANTAGWFRFYANGTDAGALSTTLPRIDGSVGTSGADLNMSSTTITVASTYTIDSFKLALPYQYGA